VAERDVLSCVSNEELGKSLPDQASTEMSKAAEVTSTGKNHNMLILLKISKYLYTFWIQKSAMGGVLKPFLLMLMTILQLVFRMLQWLEMISKVSLMWVVFRMMI
jgi:hypothetical protein